MTAFSLEPTAVDRASWMGGPLPYVGVVGPTCHWSSPAFRAPCVPADCPHHFPAVTGGGLELVEVNGPPNFPGWSAMYKFSDAILSRPALCPFCDQAVTVWKGNDDPMARAVVYDKAGSLVWAHIGCVVRVLGHRTPVQGYQERRNHGPCVLCGQPWEKHGRFGYATRSCTDEPGDDRLYHRAVGQRGPEPIWYEWKRKLQALGGDYIAAEATCDDTCPCRALVAVA